MRIGVAAEWIGEQVGGLERYAASLIRNLVRVDPIDEFEIFLTPRGRSVMADLESSRTRIRATASSSRWYYVPFGLPLAARNHPVDVLHATFTIAPWCPSKRVVFTVHDLCPVVHPDFFPAPVRARVRWLLGQGIARADWIVTPSATVRDELAEHYGFPADQVTVIPHGVEATVRDTGAALSPEEEEALRAIPSEFVLYVGRFHARKNLPRLVEAMARLKGRRGTAVPLVIVGRDLWAEQPLRQRIGELGLDDDVIFPGYVSDVVLAHLYRRARLFAFPTLNEGFGIPTLEAMAHGVPVVTSNLSCMPEVCGDAAQLVDPYDVDALSHGIERVLDDEALREHLIDAGLARVREFTWERSARMHLEVYRQVASRQHAA